jgi:hypothetical protein
LAAINLEIPETKVNRSQSLFENLLTFLDRFHLLIFAIVSTIVIPTTPGKGDRSPKNDRPCDFGYDRI